MKKLVVYLCVSVLVLGLTACGGDDNMNQNDSNQVENTTEASPASTGEPEATQAPVEDNMITTDTDLLAVREAVVEALGENYWPNAEIAPEFLEDYGLTTDMYDGFLGETPMISVNVDTMIVIRAKEGQVDAVEAVLQNYREGLLIDTMQYPMNLGKIQASKIATFGNYVCFVQLGADTTEIYGEDGNEEAVIKHCQEQNELALSAIETVVSQ